MAPEAEDVTTPRNLGTVPDRAWLSYVAMRESGALAALNRRHEQERAEEISRAEREEREWRSSVGAGAFVFM